MPLNESPNRLESAFIQRDGNNQFYEQINISGSDLIIYHSSSGILTADKISVWAAKYNIGGSGSSSSSTSASWASQSLFSISASWASRSISSSYSETSSIIIFNGNRPIKRGPYTSLNVGGDDLTEFIENFFFPFISASIVMTNAGTTYFETGSTTNFTITASIAINDETSFGTASVRKSGVEWNISTIPPYTMSFVDSNLSSSNSYIAYAQTDNNGSPTIISTSTRTATFIFPYLWGMNSTPGLSGNSLYTTFTRQVQAQGNKSVSLVGLTTYIYFCYPASYAVLTSILDPNLFDVFGSFEYSASVPVTSSGLTTNWMANYKVYRTTLIADPNGTFQFRI